MKRYIQIIIFCSIITSAHGQKIFIGGGAFTTIENYLPSEYRTRIGIEGICEIQPFNFGLVASVSPNIIFNDDNYNILLSAPIEIKYLIGDRFKIYPAIGYLLRTHYFSGVSTGLGLELDIKKDIKAGIKCNRIGGVYGYKDHSRNLSSIGEISYQINAYILHRLK
jgi:hypothetical protein